MLPVRRHALPVAQLVRRVVAAPSILLDLLLPSSNRPGRSWRVKVYGGTGQLTGREIRLRKTCKTERAALIELGKLLEQAAAGRQAETNATVAELMDRYVEGAGAGSPAVDEHTQRPCG